MQGVVVSIFSVANCIGRMTTALLPERVGDHIIPRTHFLVAGCLATALAALMDAFSSLDMLPYTALVTGASPMTCPRVLAHGGM